MAEMPSAIPPRSGNISVDKDEASSLEWVYLELVETRVVGILISSVNTNDQCGRTTTRRHFSSPCFELCVCFLFS